MSTTTTLKHTTLRNIWVDTSGDVEWDGPEGTQSGTAVFVLLGGHPHYLTYRERLRDAIELATAIDRRLEEMEDLLGTVVGLSVEDELKLLRAAAYDTLHKAVSEGNRRPRAEEAVEAAMNYGTGFEMADGRVLRVRRIGINFYIGTLSGNFKILYGPYTTGPLAELRAADLAAGATPENWEIV